MFDSDRLVWDNAADPLATAQLIKGERRTLDITLLTTDMQKIDLNSYFIALE